MIDSGYILAMLFFVLPQALWGTSIVAGLLIVASVVVEWLGFLAATLAVVVFFIGGILLGGGIWGYFRITVSRDDILHSKIVWLMENYKEYSDEDVDEMVDVLVEFETVGSQTIQFWSDVNYSDDEWKWWISPRAIRAAVDDPSFTMPRLIFPFSVESHRRWRILGEYLLCIGFVIHFLFSGEQYLPIIQTLATILLSFITMEFLFGSS